MSLEERCQPIQLILSDVDGVLTDGHIVLDNQGIESKRFHIRDGLGIRLWQKAGYRFGVVTQRSSQSLKVRAAELGIDIVRQGITDKLMTVKQILAELGLAPQQACYVGDDLPDLPGGACGRAGGRGGGCLRRASPRGRVRHRGGRRLGGPARNDRDDSQGPTPLGGRDSGVLLEPAPSKATCHRHATRRPHLRHLRDRAGELLRVRDPGGPVYRAAGRSAPRPGGVHEELGRCELRPHRDSRELEALFPPGSWSCRTPRSWKAIRSRS